MLEDIEVLFHSSIKIDSSRHKTRCSRICKIIGFNNQRYNFDEVKIQ